MLRAAMPEAITDPLDQWAAMVALGPELHERPIEELVVVVGSLRAGLPLSEHARGPFHMCVATRAEVLAWARGNVYRRASVQGLDAPPPAGRAWTLAAADVPEGLLVMSFNHDIVAPSPRMLAYTRLALVPPDGGPAPGRLLTAKGGAA